MRDLDTTPPRQIAIEVELLLQLQGLVPGVRGPLSLRLAVRVHRTWKNTFPLFHERFFADDANENFVEGICERSKLARTENHLLSPQRLEARYNNIYAKLIYRYKEQMLERYVRWFIFQRKI